MLLGCRHRWWRIYPHCLRWINRILDKLLVLGAEVFAHSWVLGLQSSPISFDTVSSGFQGLLCRILFHKYSTLVLWVSKLLVL